MGNNHSGSEATFHLKEAGREGSGSASSCCGVKLRASSLALGSSAGALVFLFATTRRVARAVFVIGVGTAGALSISRAGIVAAGSSARVEVDGSGTP